MTNALAQPYVPTRSARTLTICSPEHDPPLAHPCDRARRQLDLSPDRDRSLLPRPSLHQRAAWPESSRREAGCASSLIHLQKSAARVTAQAAGTAGRPQLEASLSLEDPDDVRRGDHSEPSIDPHVRDSGGLVTRTAGGG